MGKYSMDNPDPQRHRPEPFDWEWEGCGTSVEVGFAAQLTVVPLGAWRALVRLAGTRGRKLAERVRADSERLRRCAACDSPDVVRYRAPAAGGAAGYCAACWEQDTGEVVPAGGDRGWSV